MNYSSKRSIGKFLICNSRISVVCFLMLIFGKLYSQNYFFDSYGIAEGLLQPTVYDIFQDQKDYLWLTTKYGVSRFNGKEFVSYSLEKGMAENGVRITFGDINSTIWFGHTGGGISIFDGNEFHVFSPPNEFFKSNITGILRDKKGNVWISSELSGVIKITKVGNTLKESVYEQFKGTQISERVFGSYISNKGIIYFITDDYIKYYNPNENSFVYLKLTGMPSFYQITCMFEDSKSNLWFGTFHGGLYKYESQYDRCRVFDISDGLVSNWISTISEDSNGNCWVGTWGGGINLISDKGVKSFNLENGLNDLKIWRIIKDKEGNMLIGTNEHGLSIFKGEQIVSFSTKDGLLNPQVWSVMQDKSGKFWFGTNEGISIYEESLPVKTQFHDFYKLKGTSVRIIKEDNQQRVWMGTNEDGIFTYNNKTERFTYETKLNSWLPKLVVTAIETDKLGNVWAGTLDGLVFYNYDNKEVKFYTEDSGLAGNEITSLYCDKSNRLWIGSRGAGLTILTDTSFTSLSFKDILTPTCIKEDHLGQFWVGTEVQGIFVIDPECKNIIKRYKETDGLISNTIYFLNSDDGNNMFIGSNKGLNIYDFKKDRLFTCPKKNGYSGNETKPNSSFMDSKGRLWFGTVAGINRYDPNIPNKINENPLTHIVSFKVNQKERDYQNELKLKHSENNVLIDYTSICFMNPDAVKYKVKLDGYDIDWHVTTQQTVNYPALIPKKYTFNLTAQNSQGLWNIEPLVINFQIMPPFYKTWWFILICIFVSVSFFIVYLKIRESKLIHEKQILEEKVSLRTTELAQKNKDITDSIRYAKRIQLAILPPELPFPDTFILYKPKDIVSGDFYWLNVVGNLEFLAAVDCTGHGVPGAFMSIIGYNSLNKIVKDKNVYKPSDILDLLNYEVTATLQGTDAEGKVIRDGMDMSLICYNKKTKILQFAGAFNPLWLIRNSELMVIEADHLPIGRSKLDSENNFTNHEIQIIKGDTVYFFSDGYADQFGGESGKKFKINQMKKLVLTLQNVPINKQKEVLEKTIEDWRGEIDQVDDILVIGRKFM